MSFDRQLLRYTSASRGLCFRGLAAAIGIVAVACGDVSIGDTPIQGGAAGQSGSGGLEATGGSLGGGTGGRGGQPQGAGGQAASTGQEDAVAGGVAGAGGGAGAGGRSVAAGSAGSSDGSPDVGGSAGFSGGADSAGTSGSAGAAGMVGGAGATGAAGTAGRAGAAGSAGKAGDAGSTEAAGTAGGAGTAGSAGTAGNAGTAGSGGLGGLPAAGGLAGCPEPVNTLSPCTAETPEGAECLLEDFESGSDGVPDGWSAWEWSADASVLGRTVDPDDECNHVATITSRGTANDARWERTYDLASDAYYTLTGRIRTEDVVGGFGASYTLVEGWDGCPAVTGTAPWTECDFTFGVDSTGSAGLTARLGHYSSVTNGVAWFDDLSLVRHQTVLGSHVRVMLEPAVLESVQTSDLETWIGRADQAYETYLGLVGASPDDGAALDVVSIRQHVAAAQSICVSEICWPTSAIAPEVERAGAGGAWNFGTLLRLSEFFDPAGRWVWNAEFFAALKAYHVVEALDAEVLVSTEPDVTYQGADLLQYYQAQMVQSQVGVADIIVRFIEISDTIGWEPFRDAFDYFLGLEPENVPTGFNRFDAFVQQLIASSGTNVLLLFTTPELIWVAEVAE